MKATTYQKLVQAITLLTEVKKELNLLPVEHNQKVEKTGLFHAFKLNKNILALIETKDSIFKNLL